MTYDNIKFLNELRCTYLSSSGFYIYKMLDNDTHDILVYNANTKYAKKQKRFIEQLFRSRVNAATISISRLIEDFRDSFVDDCKLLGNGQGKLGNNAYVNAETLQYEGNDNGGRIAENDSNDNLQEINSYSAVNINADEHDFAEDIVTGLKIIETREIRRGKN